MKIAVCIKQVPAHSEGRMDMETGSVLRTGAAVVGRNDLTALELAMEVKERYGACVDVFTMGPEKAREALRTGFVFGADRGFLICDPAFAGADVLATSYTLYQSISAQDAYDLILCGSQTTDGDTGQVGGALSKWLEWSFYNGVVDLSVTEEGTVTLRQVLSRQNLTWQVRCPCVLIVDPSARVPRIPSLKAKLAAKQKQEQHITLAQLKDHDRTHYGFSGSATKVRRIYAPKRQVDNTVWSNDMGQGADRIVQLAQKMRII